MRRQNIGSLHTPTLYNWPRHNGLYGLSNVPHAQPIQFDARTWNEGMGNEAMLSLYQTPLRGSTDYLIKAILQLKPFPSMWLRNLDLGGDIHHPFPTEYRLLTFLIYRGHRFKWQCGAIAENDALLLQQYRYIWAGIAQLHHTLNNNPDMGSNGRATPKRAVNLPA